MSYDQSDGWRSDGLLGGKDREFYDPFLLNSSARLPTDFRTAMDLCPFLWWMNPAFKRASIRTVAHFVTNELDYVSGVGSTKEQTEWTDFMRDSLDVFGALNVMGMEWACFQGDTTVPTEGGVYPIRELAGRTVRVLSEGGVYRPAAFKSYGVQNLWEVEFSDGRIIRATPEHQWIVRNGVGKTVRLRTDQLTKTHRIPRTVAPRPEKNADYYEGVRHGFVFGDDSLSSKNKRSTALFCGAKDVAMLPYFEGHGNAPRPRKDKKEMIRQSGFPAEFKSMPDDEASPSYWYGFVSGFLAADGCVDKYGCAMLTQVSKEVLETVIAQLPRIGMTAGPIRAQTRQVDLRKWSGPNALYTSTIHVVTLLKQFMQPDDFLIPAHRVNFEANWNPESEYGKWIGIKQIHPTNRREEVFCCEESETNSFVVGNGVLTSNCFGNSFWRIYFPFTRLLIDKRFNKTNYWSPDIFPEKLVKYHYKEMQYEVPDPVEMSKGVAAGACGTVRFNFFDRPSKDVNRISLRKMDPRQMTLKYADASGRYGFIYRFDLDWVRDVQDGVLWQVNDTSISMLRAMAEDADFEFAEDHVFHFKAPTISGVSNNGWGLPETIANYRSFHNLQVFTKLNESVARDYMLPFRIFSPNLGSGTGDVSALMNLGAHKKFLASMIKDHRRDPYAMHALPFPVHYQEASGNGKELSPYETSKYHTDDMLEAAGYPAELYRGTMALEQIPTTIRIFENSFHFVHTQMNRFVQWASRRIQSELGKANMTPTLRRPRIADDMEQRQIWLQLASAGELSREEAYGAIGIHNPVQSIKRRVDEDARIQSIRDKSNEEYQRKQLAGTLGAQPTQEGEDGGGEGSAPGASAGGPMGAPPAGASLTPMDRAAQADQEAANLLQMLESGDNASKRKREDQLRSTDPDFYALVVDRMKKMRQQGASAGRAQAGQMAAGG